MLKPSMFLVTIPVSTQPAAFRRLCVETALWAKLEALDGSSRL